ncbi:MAG: hypothetical protein K8R58_01350 [Bacteroidales bacterium]|nr:hypothetical protein [Bacteroidales bacterium]
MKKVIKLLVIAVFLLTAPVCLLAQTPPHPNGGSAPGGGNTPVGGGAPIDGGLSIMLILGAAYGSKKIYNARKKV